jgi:hypothetical protein
MKMAEYANNHVVTAGYTRGFTDGSGNVLRVDLANPHKAPEPRRPETVGRRRYYFEDPVIARTMERHLSRIESAGLEVLREIDALWPFDPDNRFDQRWKLARLVALHMVRTPDFHTRTARATTLSVAQRLPEYSLNAGQQEELLEFITSEQFVVGHMMSMIRKNASLIASAHWTLIEFDDRLLASSDQPVTIVPILPKGATTRLEPQPPTGLLNCEEIRFPISPHRALLFTWLNDLDVPAPVRGDAEIAANLNRATIGQADQEWFYHPALRPTRLPSRGVFTINECSAIGRNLLPDYDAEAASESPRREEARNCIERMTEEDEEPDADGKIKIYVGRVKQG